MAGSSTTGLLSKASGQSSDTNDALPYNYRSDNWFKSLPYGFAFNDKKKKAGDDPTIIIYLPISPSNIQVTTHYATNIVTTLYGIVEEHSEVRYYDIVIQGTTGFAPRYPNAIIDDTDNSSSTLVQTSGRASFDSSGGVSLGGFLPEVTNTINQAAKLVNSITSLGQVQNASGIAPDNSGYAAFHKLYQFFLKYKQDTAGKSTKGGSAKDAAINLIKSNLPTGVPSVDSKPSRDLHPLQFLNYKDGLQYDCVPLSFNMVRSADNPMMYNYVIRLRAFNLRSVTDNSLGEADQLAKLGLGSADGQSIFSSLSGIASNAATLISGIL